MNTKTYNKFKQLLTEKCDAHVKKGGKFCTQVFRIDTQTMCPVNCLIEPRGPGEGYFDAASQRLGDVVDEKDYWDFIDGFDGNIIPDARKSKSQLFKLGRKFRQIYKEHIA